MPRFVYAFAEGDRTMRDLLGGKGANLAEMTAIGLPVPDGFTITTEACLAYLRSGNEWPDGLSEQVGAAVEALESRVGATLGGGESPLLVSVRSGAPVSMPGMMDTILNLGLNDASVAALAETTGDPRFAYDSYRRLIQMFGNVVMGVSINLFEDLLGRAKLAKGVTADVDLDGGRADRTGASIPGCVPGRDRRASFHRLHGHSSISQSPPCSSRGTLPARLPIVAVSAWMTTWARPSTSSRWSLATPGNDRGRVLRSRVIRRRESRTPMASFSKTLRARTSSREPAPDCRSTSWRGSSPRPTARWWR